MIYLLTPTGDRPECLTLLARHIVSQTYQKMMFWVIVDDGEKKFRIKGLPNNIFPIYIDLPKGQGTTQARNMLRGLANIPAKATVLVLEDDDAYLPGHVENMLGALEQDELVGERTSHYYNVATRRHRTMRGSQHASMASVGVRGGALKALRTICGAYNTALDLQLWKGFKGSKKLLDTRNVIGIKGMPGRKGLGVGHKANFGSVDDDNVLEGWVGQELAIVYKSFGAEA